MQKLTWMSSCLLVVVALAGCGGGDEGEQQRSGAGEGAPAEEQALGGELEELGGYAAFAVGPAPSDPVEEEVPPSGDVVTVGEGSYGVSGLGVAPVMLHCAVAIELGVSYQGEAGLEALHIDFDVYGYQLGEEPVTVELPSSGGWVSAVRCPNASCDGGDAAWLADASGRVTLTDRGDTLEISDLSLSFGNASDGRAVTVDVAYAEVADPFHY